MNKKYYVPTKEESKKNKSNKKDNNKKDSNKKDSSKKAINDKDNSKKDSNKKDSSKKDSDKKDSSKTTIRRSPRFAHKEETPVMKLQLDPSCSSADSDNDSHNYLSHRESESEGEYIVKETKRKVSTPKKNDFDYDSDCDLCDEVSESEGEYIVKETKRKVSTPKKSLKGVMDKFMKETSEKMELRERGYEKLMGMVVEMATEMRTMKQQIKNNEPTTIITTPELPQDLHQMLTRMAHDIQDIKIGLNGRTQEITAKPRSNVESQLQQHLQRGIGLLKMPELTGPHVQGNVNNDPHLQKIRKALRKSPEESTKRLEKLNNVVVCQMPETEAISLEPAIKEIESLKQVVLEFGGNPNTISACFRMGRTKAGRQRPLKVKSTSATTKQIMMRQDFTIRLKSVQNVPTTHPMYIRPDFTSDQQFLDWTARRIKAVLTRRYSMSISMRGIPGENLTLDILESGGWQRMGDPFDGQFWYKHGLSQRCLYENQYDHNIHK